MQVHYQIPVISPSLVKPPITELPPGHVAHQTIWNNGRRGVWYFHGFPGISLIFVQLSLFNKKAKEFLYACEVANFNEKKRITYFEDKMSEIDYFYEMDCERAEGRAEGRAEVARTMLADGLDSSLVSKYSGLSIEQVEELKKGL